MSKEEKIYSRKSIYGNEYSLIIKGDEYIFKVHNTSKEVILRSDKDIIKVIEVIIDDMDGLNLV